MVNSKDQGMASEIISLYKDLIDMKPCNNHRVSVLKPYLFVLVCLLIELHWNLKVCCLYVFIYFFFKIGASRLGGGAYLQVQLIPELLRCISP